MTTDLVLAILHHIAVFNLFALLMIEGVLLKPGMGPVEVARVSKIDAAYGIMAGVVLAVGVLRVLYGIKGWTYYEANPWFWAKMACFAAVALVSIAPTMRFVGWRRRLRADPAFAPDGREVAAARLLVRLQALFFVLILVFAATMARMS